MKNTHWLVCGVSIHSDGDLRSSGCTDETLIPPYAYRVRQRTWTNDNQGRYIETTLIVVGPSSLTYNNTKANHDSVGWKTKRAQLLDDIDALCLSIETRQKQLSQLVKELQNEIK